MTRNYIVKICASFLLGAMALACADDTLEIQVLYSRRASTSASYQPTNLEIINNEDRLAAVVTALDELSAGPNAQDGGSWPPTVDFDHHVVAFAAIRFNTIPEDVEVRRATESDDRVKLEISAQWHSCYGDDLLSTFYALVQMPRIDKPYVLATSYSPKCN